MAKDNKPAKFPIYSIINDFERKSFEDIEIRYQERSMFYALINLCMHKGGIPQFEIQYQFLMHISKIGSPSTYYKVLDTLQAKGIINYQKGKNAFSMATITLLFDDSTTTKLKSYWEAIIRSTKLPVVLDTLKAFKKAAVYNYKDNSDNIDKNNIQIKDTQSRTDAQAASARFEQFWAAYGKNVNKAEAKIEWEKLEPSEHDEIINKVKDYVSSKPDKMYRKNASNFLKDKTWKDEIITKKTNKDDELRRISAGPQDYTKKTF